MKRRLNQFQYLKLKNYVQPAPIPITKYPEGKNVPVHFPLAELLSSISYTKSPAHAREYNGKSPWKKEQGKY
jgi:hypothetical protein